MKISKNSKLMMIGDSITDAGRGRPVGEQNGLGTGYVSLVNILLETTYPTHSIRVMNQGTSGNTVRDLAGRWQSDVMEFKPNWLSIMIGINDVWRQFDTPLRKDLHVSIDEYERTLDKLISSTLPILDGLVLMTPYFIETNLKDAMRIQMDQYGQVVKKLATKHGAIFVDTQKAFNRILETGHPMQLAWDRVHPNLTGHMLIARAFLDAVEFKW